MIVFKNTQPTEKHDMTNVKKILATLVTTACLGCANFVLAQQPILLIDFMNQNGATNPASPDANGNHWNIVGQGGSNYSDLLVNSTDLRLTNGTVVTGLNFTPSSDFGNPTSDNQWSGGTRTGQPDWVASDSLTALEDRFNLNTAQNGTHRLEGLPALNPGEYFRIEVVSATTASGTDNPALWNLESGNSIGGNQTGNNVGSLVPFNGLNGNPLQWIDNGGSNANRFGYAFFPNTASDPNVAPSDGWIVWDGVLPDGNNGITLHVSTQGSSGNQRGPINALAVYVIPEPGTLMLLIVGGLFVYIRRRR